jgi:hypothetical protein
LEKAAALFTDKEVQTEAKTLGQYATNETGKMHLKNEIISCTAAVMNAAVLVIE